MAMIFLDLRKSFEFWDSIKRFKLAESISHLKSRKKREAKYLSTRLTSGLSLEVEDETGLATHSKWDLFYCRVQLTQQKQCDSISDIFTVEICGSIHAPTEQPVKYVTLHVSIMDVTDRMHRPKPVRCRVKRWQMQNSSAFCYNADLGKLPSQTTTLSDWIKVAQLNTDWLIFPRRGKRNLQFIISVLSRQDGQELACGKCNFAYINPKPGYIDTKEYIQRTKTLAVTLAFSVSAADRKLYKCEIELIKEWARAKFDYAQVSDKKRHKLEKALDKTVTFFRYGNQFNTYAICKEIVKIAPVALRYDILELCLRVAQAKGSVAVEELSILKDLASWLEVDTNRFRAMMEKTLPVNMHQVRDVEVTLGVTADMSNEKTRQQLNREYSKWSSRATSFNPEIRAQADQMLKIIAEARRKYIQ